MNCESWECVSSVNGAWRCLNRCGAGKLKLGMAKNARKGVNTENTEVWRTESAENLSRKKGRAEDGPAKKKGGQAGMPVPKNHQKSRLWKLKLLISFGFYAVVGEREARLVAVAGVFVKHALGDGLVDGGHRGVEEIARSGGVAGGDGGAQAAHQRADPGAIGAVHLRALTRLRRPLQNRLFLLLNFGSLSLGHLLLLLRTAQTSNVKRGSRLCQTRRKVLPARKCRPSR